VIDSGKAKGTASNGIYKSAQRELDCFGPGEALDQLASRLGFPAVPPILAPANWRVNWMF